MMLPGFPIPFYKRLKAIPEFVSASTGQVASGASLIISAPAGLADGDLLFAVLVGGVANQTISGSGWTSEASRQASSFAVLSKIAAASDANYTFTFSNSANAKGGAIVCYRNDPIIDIIGSITGTTSTTGVAPSVSPSRAGVLLGFFSGTGTVTIVTPPSGMTQRALQGTGNAKAAVYELTPSPPGATGTRSIVWSSSTTVNSMLSQIA